MVGKSIIIDLHYLITKIKDKYKNIEQVDISFRGKDKIRFIVSKTYKGRLISKTYTVSINNYMLDLNSEEDHLDRRFEDLDHSIAKKTREIDLYQKDEDELNF